MMIKVTYLAVRLADIAQVQSVHTVPGTKYYYLVHYPSCDNIVCKNITLLSADYNLNKH